VPRVDIPLNGRRYPVACDEGQEDRVREIAAFIDGKLAEVRRGAAGASDTHLQVMVSLLVCDELFDARSRLASRGYPQGPAHAGPAGGEVGPAVVDVISRLSNRVEAIASRLERS
jgi:cell division protein ZapA